MVDKCPDREYSFERKIPCQGILVQEEPGWKSR